MSSHVSLKHDEAKANFAITNACQPTPDMTLNDDGLCIRSHTDEALSAKYTAGKRLNKTNTRNNIPCKEFNHSEYSIIHSIHSFANSFTYSFIY